MNTQAPVLSYWEQERRCSWDGREWYLRGQEHKLFCLLHRHMGHWVAPERIEPILWPARSPDTWRNIVSQVATDLARSLVGTSCHIGLYKDSGVYGLGYRLVGNIEWIKEEVDA